jgi:hypothetical protein
MEETLSYKGMEILNHAKRISKSRTRFRDFISKNPDMVPTEACNGIDSGNDQDGASTTFSQYSSDPWTTYSISYAGRFALFYSSLSTIPV